MRIYKCKYCGDSIRNVIKSHEDGYKGKPGCEYLWSRIDEIFAQWRDERINIHRLCSQYNVSDKRMRRTLVRYCAINNYNFASIDMHVRKHIPRGNPYAQKRRADCDYCADCDVKFGAMNTVTGVPFERVEEVKRGVSKGRRGYLCRECSGRRDGQGVKSYRERVFYHSPERAGTRW